MIHRERLEFSLEKEKSIFIETHKKSQEAYLEKGEVLLYSAPMNWMQMWPGGFPISIERAKEDTLVDLDGNTYTDFCLGYSAGLTGHGGEEICKTFYTAMKDGMVYTLPSKLDAQVGRLLKERFGQEYWGFALSATDANRFSIKLARQVTKRRKILIFNGCYHGTVEETFAYSEEGKTTTRVGQIGIAYEVGKITTAIEFNDLDALQKELEKEEYACLLLEPVMTNCGIIHPEEGYLTKAKALCKKHGTIFIIDEAHTITAGPRGYTGEYNLEPDILVLGKCIGGGFPVGAYGIRKDLKTRVDEIIKAEFADTSGIGGTMTGSVMAMHAIKAALEIEITPENMYRAKTICDYFSDCMTNIIVEYHLPWHMNRLGSRADISFSSIMARNAKESFAIHDHDLYEYLFIGAMNRGFVFSPYYNIMATFSYYTRKETIDDFILSLRELLDGICTKD